MANKNIWTPEKGKEEMIGFVSRNAEKGKINYYLHVLKLIDDKQMGILKEWHSVIDFMRIPKQSKLGKDLIKLENKGAFK